MLSRALHADDPSQYTVVYRDKELLKELPLEQFLELSEGFRLIPAWRIEEVRRAGRPVYVKRAARGARGKV